jgi:hypothetical protein
MTDKLKRFVLMSLRETRGIELDLNEIESVSTVPNPVTGTIDVHATIVMRAPPLKIVITAKQSQPKEKPE